SSSYSVFIYRFLTRRSSDLVAVYVKFLVERICNAGPQLEVYVTVRYRAQVANFALQGSGIGHGEVKTECEVILEHNGAPLRFEQIGRAHVELQSRENLVCRL